MEAMEFREERSDRLDMLSTWSLGTLSFTEGDPLPFSQLIETDSIQTGRVEKEIPSLSGIDEAETLVRHFLDDPFSHLRNSSC